MVYRNQNYLVSELCPSPDILKLDNIAFRKLDLFPSSGEGGTPALLGLLERSNLNLRDTTK
jgi:hypothetical protein